MCFWSLLFWCVIFGNVLYCELWNTLTTQDTVAAVFNSTIKFPGPCTYLPGTRQQNRQCRKDYGLPEVLKETRLLAIKHCEDQFRYDRWNCSIETSGKRNIFKRLYRETAFIYAITSAAMTHSIARACSQGLLMRCSCNNSGRYGNAKSNWLWNGCDDNLNYGKRITRIFLNLKSTHRVNRSELLELVRHNSEVGIQTVSALSKQTCKCHGISGSCSVKTCWKKLAQFNTTASSLRSKYNQAGRKSAIKKQFQHNLLKQTSSNRKQIGEKSILGHKLIYLHTSPTFCSVTRGRRCLNRENCAVLCCGRGYNIKIFHRTERCRCRFKDNRCCTVLCDYCPRLEDRLYCK